MKILVCGAMGFVGRNLTIALRKAGHTVKRGVRRPTEPGDISIDFSRDTDKDDWLKRLEGVEVVINAVGVLRDIPGKTMRYIHAETPAALFSAASESNVQRLIQISALGVDSGISTSYFSTKMQAESTLQSLPEKLRWLCLRPSVIYGEDGTSARMFRFLARLPLHALPMGGQQRLQPVHIDDICLAVTNWLADPKSLSQIVAAVGADATDMRGMLDSYREQQGHGSALHITMPSPLVKMAALLGDHIPASPLCSDTLTMLNAGNTADSSEFSRLLGRTPRSYRDFISQK